MTRTIAAVLLYSLHLLVAWIVPNSIVVEAFVREPVPFQTLIDNKNNKNNNGIRKRDTRSSYSSSYWIICHGARENIQNYEEMLSISESTKDCFKHKTILITGASGGLGREMALQLATCGVKKLILSARNSDILNEVAKECKAKANDTLKVHVVLADLADHASVQRLGETAMELCSDNEDDIVDVLINNGGVSSRSTFLETSYQIDEKVMQINFLSGVALAKLLIPLMVRKYDHEENVENGGKLIWISSVQGKVGIPSRTSYAASKFAVQGYCEGLRAELATSGVMVHVASPGYIRTNLSASAITGDGSAYGKTDATTAAGADPKDVAVSILDSVAQGKEDFVVAASTSAIAAIWLRLLCPGLLRNMLVQRFQKSQLEQQDESKPKTD